METLEEVIAQALVEKALDRDPGVWEEAAAPIAADFAPAVAAAVRRRFEVKAR